MGPFESDQSETLQQSGASSPQRRKQLQLSDEVSVGDPNRVKLEKQG